MSQHDSRSHFARFYETWIRGAMDDKEKYLRWLEILWDLHEGITREEQRKEEVLKMFEGLGKLARNHVEAPHFPPWEAPW